MATLILRPIGDTAMTDQTRSAGNLNYALIDETTKDESDYCSNPDNVSSTKTDIYSFQNHDTETETINSVTIKCYAAYALVGSVPSGDAYVNPMVRVSDTNYFGGKQALSATAVLYYHTWTVNPNTLSTWTWKQIDDLQAGDALTNYVVDKKNFKSPRCYQLWAEVAYGEASKAILNTLFRKAMRHMIIR